MITKEESEAMKRLKELGGFSDTEALQALRACEGNEGGLEPGKHL